MCVMHINRKSVYTNCDQQYTETQIIKCIISFDLKISTAAFSLYGVSFLFSINSSHLVHFVVVVLL